MEWRKTHYFGSMNMASNWSYFSTELIQMPNTQFAFAVYCFPLMLPFSFVFFNKPRRCFFFFCRCAGFFFFFVLSGEIDWVVNLVGANANLIIRLTVSMVKCIERKIGGLIILCSALGRRFLFFTFELANSSTNVEMLRIVLISILYFRITYYVLPLHQIRLGSTIQYTCSRSVGRRKL